MRTLLAFVIALSSLAQAAQVTLRQGETGRIGAKVVQVMRVQDRRCGPNEDCMADVIAQVRIQEGKTTSTVLVSLPPPQPQKWSGVGVAALQGDAVTFTSQPPGTSAPSQRLTLKRGQTGRLGTRQVTLQGWETAHCHPTVLCIQPVRHTVYVRVKRGSKSSWLSLEYPPPPAWPGLTLVKVTQGEHPALTFTDQRP